jgi:D-aminoacyl-tRNA deacylase
MIAVIQRVNEAYVDVEGERISSISKGILCFLGIQKEDKEVYAEKLLQKIIELRIFADADGKMNLSLQDVKGSLLLVSQFTLAGDCRKGKRPSFDSAEKPLRAEELYNYALNFAKGLCQDVQAGKFQANMQVGLENDGPVTFILEVKD